MLLLFFIPLIIAMLAIIIFFTYLLATGKIDINNLKDFNFQDDDNAPPTTKPTPPPLPPHLTKIIPSQTKTAPPIIKPTNHFIKATPDPKKPSLPDAPKPSLPYSKKNFFSKNEKTFFLLLQKTVQKKFIIMAKVRLWDIIDTKINLPYKEKTIFQNKIKQKHLDFVLISPETLQILLAIELDDKSHEKKDAQERDDFKNSALETVNIPLLRFKTSDQLSIKLLRKKITENLYRHKN